MKALEPPDSFYLRAASSCLESGKYRAAQQELDRIAQPLRCHPDVLEIQWAVHAQAREWKACLSTAQALLDSAPERPTGWIKSSFVLHRLKRTQEALNTLFPAAEKFSDVAVIPYNLACYAAQLEHLWEAERWLKRALEIGGDHFRALALQEKDLEALREKIREL